MTTRGSWEATYASVLWIGEEASVVGDARPADGQANQTVPAVIIGVGGTGDWVLREIKSAFKRANGAVPPNIKFVGIDTAPPGGAIRPDKPLEGAQGNQDRDPELPPLDPIEHVRVAGNLKPISEAVHDAIDEFRGSPHDTSSASLPHLRDWFLADSYLRHLPQATFLLNNGAGQLRQFGRMGVFETEGYAARPLRSAIRRALQAVANFGANDRSVEVYIVSSVAGGTGAGMVIDVAHIARQEARQLGGGRPITVRAFLFMANTFQGIQGINLDAMQARAYATMREINRFTNDFDSAYGYPMAYSAQAVGVAGERIKNSLFDHVYYIDGYAVQNNFIGQLPTRADFPMVAEAIRSLIDAASGEGYSAFAANARGIKNDLKGTPVASSVAATAFVLPVQAMRRLFEVRLAQEALDVIAPIVVGAVGDVGIDRLDPRARVSGIDGQAGREVAMPFLQAAQANGDRGPDGTVRSVSVPFAKEIAAVADIYRAGVPTTLDTVAKRSRDTFRNAFGGLDEPSVTPAKLVAAQAKSNVAQDVDGPGQGSGWWPSSQVEASRALDRDETQHLTLQFGTVGGGDGGAYRAALELWQKFNQERFRQVLGYQVDALLTPADTTVPARRARLGHVQDFLEGVRGHLVNYQSAMEALEARRNQLRLTTDQSDRLDAARLAMLSDAATPRRLSWPVISLIAIVVGAAVGLVVGLSGSVALWAAITVGVVVALVIGFGMSLWKGPAYATQVEFIDAVQAVHEEYEMDALIRAMKATASTMARDVVALQTSIEAWAQALRTAPAKRSAWGRLTETAAEIGRVRQAGERTLARTFLWDDSFDREQYARYVGTSDAVGHNPKVSELVTQLRWEKVRWVGGQPTLPGLRIDDNGKDFLIQAPQFRTISGGGVVADDDSINHVSQSIEEQLRAWARKAFDGFEASVDIVSYLRKHPRYRSPEAFAQALLEGARAVRLDVAGRELTQRLRYNFLRIPDGSASDEREAADARRWVDDVVEQLKLLAGNASGASGLIRGRSMDRHSCALVYTADFIHLENEILGYIEAQEKYRSYLDTENDLGRDRRVLHIFPAEMNASQYEQQMPTLLRSKERALDNRVVQLLEHPARVQQFLQARALGLIKVTRTAAGRASAVDADDAKLNFSLNLERLGAWTLTKATETHPDIYAAMAQYVCGEAGLSSGGQSVGPDLVAPISFVDVERTINQTLKKRVPGEGPQQILERRGLLYSELVRYWRGDDSEQSQFERDLAATRRLETGDPVTFQAERLNKDFSDLLKMLLIEETTRLNAVINDLRGAS